MTRYVPRAFNRQYGVAPAVSVLVGLYALGLIGAGIFVTDPVGDYQPDGEVVSGPNLNGSLHTAFSMVVFIALPAACFVLAGGNVARGSIGWASVFRCDRSPPRRGLCLHVDRFLPGHPVATPPAGRGSSRLIAADHYHYRLGLADPGCGSPTGWVLKEPQSEPVAAPRRELGSPRGAASSRPGRRRWQPRPPTHLKLSVSAGI